MGARGPRGGEGRRRRDPLRTELGGSEAWVVIFLGRAILFYIT